MADDLRAWLRGHVWALDLDRLDVYAPAALEHWAAVLDARQAESRQIAARLMAGSLDEEEEEAAPAGPIAALRLFGFISARPSLSSLFYGGMNLQDLRMKIARALASPEVRSIVLDIDSPGGSVYGVHQTWAAIREADRIKPVHAVISGLGASAAYWLASAARTISIAPLAEAGSIGIIGVHADKSAFWHAQGVTHTILTAGAHKAEGNDLEPLAPEAEASIRRRIDAAYSHFVADVAAGRKTTPELVRLGYGEGRLLSAEDAARAGLVDRSATFEDVIAAETTRIGDLRRRETLATLSL